MGASIETTLEAWASSLRDVKARMGPLFTQERVAVSAGLFLGGCCAGDQRDRLSQARQVVVWGGAAIYGVRGQDHRPPGQAEGWLDRDRRVRGLRVLAQPRLH